MKRTGKAAVKCRGASKRLFSLILSLVMTVALFSAYSLEVGANAAMSSISVQWANPQKLRKINKKLTETVLTANVNGTATDIHVSFPKEGGVRINTDNTGYFAPKALNNIDYYLLEDDSILLESGGISVRLQYKNYPWSLEVLNSNDKVVYTVTARQMYFGYKNGTLRKVKLEGKITDDDFITGLGERYNSVNQVGKKVKLWNMDTGYHAAASTTEKDLAYTNVPILTSINGYTVFFNTYYGGYADIGKADSEKWSLDFNTSEFDFYVYAGDPISNIQSYTSLTGKPFTAPYWAYGYWAGGTGGHWSAGYDEYLDEAEDKIAAEQIAMKKNVEATLKKYKEMGTMPSAIYLESMPFCEGMLEVANSYGVRGLSWNNPSITPLRSSLGQQGLNLTNLKELLPDVLEELLPAPFNYDGTSRQDYWGDFSNPNMKQAQKNGGYTKLIANGLAGAMIDYGEYIDESMSFYNGMKGDEMHNYYAYVYNKTINEIFKEETGTENDFVLFARAGCAGSQQFAGSFGGDQAASFDGLTQAYYGGITAAASGFANWGSDIGSLSGDLTTQLYLRWLQFGTFSPFMRVHGGSERDPWGFGTIGVNTFKELYNLRKGLQDYIYGANLEAGKNGTPIMQAMGIAFPEQKSLAKQEYQYMFGSELLVVPVLSENTDYLSVTFPNGKWTDIFNGKTYEGNATIATPSNVIPVYLRDGGVIKATVASDFSLTGDMNGKTYDAVIAAPAANEHTASFKTDDKTYTFKNKPEGKDGFTVSNTSKHSAKLVIAAGTTASSVKVNGKALNKLNTLPKDDSATGYYVDYETRRTLVFTGGNWSTVSVVDSNMAYKNLVLDATVVGDNELINDQVMSIIDSDPTSMWMIHSQEDGVGVIDLGSLKKVNKLVVNWSSYAAESYKLEVSASANGGWKNINNSACIGGAETYDVSGSEIRYIRLSEIVKAEGTTASPGITDIEVYGDELADESIIEVDNEIIVTPDDTVISTDTSVDTDDDTDEPDSEKTEDIVKKRRKKITVPGSGGLSTVAIVLIIVGAVAVVAAGVTVFVILYRKKKRLKA